MSNSNPTPGNQTAAQFEAMGEGLAARESTEWTPAEKAAYEAAMQEPDDWTPEVGDRVVNEITSDHGTITEINDDELLVVSLDDGGEAVFPPQDCVPEDEAPSSSEPAEEDYVIYDNPGGSYGVGSVGGKDLGGVYHCLEQAYQAIKDDAGANFRPDVWLQDDHGGHRLVERFPWDTTVELG